jgi:hypothetical protein
VLFFGAVTICKPLGIHELNIIDVHTAVMNLSTPYLLGVVKRSLYPNNRRLELKIFASSIYLHPYPQPAPTQTVILLEYISGYPHPHSV